MSSTKSGESPGRTLRGGVSKNYLGDHLVLLGFLNILLNFQCVFSEAPGKIIIIIIKCFFTLINSPLTEDIELVKALFI